MINLTKKKIAKKGKKKWQRGIDTTILQEEYQNELKQNNLKDKVKNLIAKKHR